VLFFAQFRTTHASFGVTKRAAFIKLLLEHLRGSSGIFYADAKRREARGEQVKASAGSCHWSLVTSFN
jgi:hypothetical protein